MGSTENLVPTIGEVSGTEGRDGLGSGDSPVHAGSLLALTCVVLGYIYPVVRYLQRAGSSAASATHTTGLTVRHMLLGAALSGVALLFRAEVNAEAERSRELRRGEPAEDDLQAPAKA